MNLKSVTAQWKLEPAADLETEECDLRAKHRSCVMTHAEKQDIFLY
jgi:hypothetical protein